MERVYVSGGMTGIPDHNRQAFAAASQRLREAGYAVVSPSEMNNPHKELTWEEYLKADLSLLFHCDTIALLPGWEKSRGAQLELAVALKLGMRAIDAETLEAKPMHIEFSFAAKRANS